MTEYVEIDPPEAKYPFVPTSAWEANYMRAYGVEFCIDNGLPGVAFHATTTHQFGQDFQIRADGVMETTMDMSAETERAEVRKIHHVR